MKMHFHSFLKPEAGEEQEGASLWVLAGQANSSS